MLPWKILWLRYEVNTRTPLTSILTEMVTVFFPLLLKMMKLYLLSMHCLKMTWKDSLITILQLCPLHR